MPLSAAGLPLSAAVAARLEVLASTGSTNADLTRAASEAPKEWPHLSVLVTDDQRSGRGRLDRSWETPAGSGLAVSVLVRVGSLPTRSRGWIPLVAGAAMARAVAAQVAESGHDARVKWPNDVLLDGAKLCGILAEVVPGHPDAVVVGAGVNTRMTAKQLPVPTATSFAVAGLEADEDRLIADYLRALDEQLRALATAHGDAAAAGVLAEVEALCATLGREVAVSLPGGSMLEGRAQRIDPDGRLVVVAGLTETAVAAGDVVHVR
ncbi:biotin--[acetyl-CoA-carboxylase] ligase [Microbacterium immunditiarum]|uniref:biotin--[biotin carboxyl-carrier protein] ligase n=1 Tax=Microbacterium immunditiarum TaxID=337480 RepID=A0A7Y9KKU2_9MICO|nr:biotin--[acetyl-CoA-carboxylase] ligase [Microbacterium immunditiarum]NYE21051.1 BirA family biotin operon repressor/biotin-[acetyl-CoA-carboxylase] ligase [Microbacterium immunditiarum]